MQIFFFTEIHLTKLNLEFRISITFWWKYYSVLYILQLCLGIFL